MADKSLLAAFAENTHDIKPAHIKAAIHDSEFHPAFPLWRIVAILALLLIGAAGFYIFQLQRSFIGYLKALPTAFTIMEPLENQIFPATVEENPAIVSSKKCLLLKWSLQI